MDRPTADHHVLDLMMARDVCYRTMRHCVELGLFDAIADATVTARELADRFQYREAAVKPLLDMLASGGILATNGEGYRNTEVAREFLASSSPFFQGKALTLHERFNQSVFDDFEALLRGEIDMRSRTDDNWGTGDTMEGTLQFARLGGLQDMVSVVCSLRGFTGMRLMCDLGGNHGQYSMDLLNRNPDLRGEVVDLPDVAAEAAKRIEQRGFARRLKATGLDLRKEPLKEDTYDLVIASHILYAFAHDLSGVVEMVYAALRNGGWFAAQHMAEGSGKPEPYERYLEFVSKMTGYPTHFIDRKHLSDAMREAGFDTVVTAPSAGNTGTLIIAARKGAS